MTVSLSLMLIGTEDDPRWVTDMRSGSWSPRWTYCCEEGHYTPESAAAHGAELSAAAMVREVRNLQPPACGAVAIAKLEAA